MSRRPDPERIHEARRLALRNQLLDQDRIPTDQVDIWLAAWAIEAEDRGLDRLTAPYWNAGREWILERRSARKGS